MQTEIHFNCLRCKKDCVIKYPIFPIYQYQLAFCSVWCHDLYTIFAPNKRVHWTLRLLAYLKNKVGLGSRQ